MKTFLIAALLAMGISGAVYCSHEGVDIIGGLTGCVSQNCGPTPRSQVIADIDKEGNVTWIRDEDTRSVLYHGVDKSGTHLVSCSGGCKLNRGFFGTTVCDSEGICLELRGWVTEVDHKIEISN